MFSHQFRNIGILYHFFHILYSLVFSHISHVDVLLVNVPYILLLTFLSIIRRKEGF